MIGWAAAVWAGTLALQGVAGYYAITLTQIAVALVVLVVFDRLLARRVSHSLLRQAAPALFVCIVLAFAGWWVAEAFASDAFRTVIVFGAVYGAAVAATAVALRGLSLRRGRPLDVGATGNGSAASQAPPAKWRLVGRARFSAAAAPANPAARPRCRGVLTRDRSR